MSVMYDKMKQIKTAISNKSGSKTTRVRNADGLIANSAVQGKTFFRDYFCKLLGGQAITFEDLCKKNREDNIHKDHITNESYESFMESLPIWTDIANIMKHSKNKIAWGENNICPKIYAMFPMLMAFL